VAYNGWKNYPTWALFTWLTNEEGGYLYWTEKAQALGLSELEAELKGWLEEETGALGNGILKDLLTFAIGEIDFQEVAEGLKEG